MNNTLTSLNDASMCYVKNNIFYMAIKWGSSNVTAVKWGSTNITKVYWGNTQVFPDLLVIFNGGNASSTFTGRTHASRLGGWGNYGDYGWKCYSADKIKTVIWLTDNPGDRSSFSLTNGLSADCWRTVTYNSDHGETRSYVGYVKFMTNNKVNLTNKTTIEITITTQTYESYGSVPIYVAGVSSLKSSALWCVIAWAALRGTSTRSITIPAANRNADCHLAVATTYTSESGGEEYDNYGQGRPSTITKITSY